MIKVKRTSEKTRSNVNQKIIGISLMKNIIMSLLPNFDFFLSISTRVSSLKIIYISIVFPLNNCLIGLLVLFFFIFPLLDTTLVFFIFGSPEGLLVLFLVFSDVLVLVTTFMFTSHPLYFLRDAILNCHDRD